MHPPRIIAAVASAWLSVAPAHLLAHGGPPHEGKPFDASQAEQKRFGIAADPAKATHTIRIGMSDKMRFTPDSLTVRVGETVRFLVRNQGKLMHELVLGTKEELERHAEEMRKFPDMEHDEAHMLHVKPGSTGALAWTFNQPGEFHFACLIPGHYEAGMKGRIVVR